MTDTPITPQEIPQTPEPQKPQPRGKMPSVIAFAAGLLVFLLPFVEIRCNNMSLKKVSGAELATGFKMDALGTDNSLFNNLDKGLNGNTGSNSSNSGKKDPNVYALAALVLGALGLLLSFSNIKAGGIGGVLTGALAAASLIGLWIDIRKQLKTDLSVKDVGADVSISVDFTPWFYISVVGFITAAYFSYKRMKA